MYSDRKEMVLNLGSQQYWHIKDYGGLLHKIGKKCFQVAGCNICPGDLCNLYNKEEENSVRNFNLRKNQIILIMTKYMHLNIIYHIFNSNYTVLNCYQLFGLGNKVLIAVPHIFKYCMSQNAITVKSFDRNIPILKG